MTYTQVPAMCEKNIFPLIISFHSASEKLLFSHNAGSHVKLSPATSQSIEWQKTWNRTEGRKSYSTSWPTCIATVQYH